MASATATQQDVLSFSCKVESARDVFNLLSCIADGKPHKESKSEVLFCSKPLRMYADASTFDGANLSDVLLPGGLFMPIVSCFPYLGRKVSRSGSDLPDVDSRVESAGKAFGMLSACLFRSTAVTRKAKRTVYEGEILSILLYGSETWLLTEAVLQRLRCFHVRCLRAMCRVTRVHTREQHISTWELQQEMGLESIDVYVARRQVRWLGHVARMPFERTPRRMLSSWVPAPRPAGGQLMTFGRSAEKAMGKFNIPFSTWAELAADRAAWRDALHGGLLVAARPKRAAATTADELIDIAIADARASILDIDAAIATFCARAAAARRRAAAAATACATRGAFASQPASAAASSAAMAGYDSPLNAAQS